MKTLSFRNVDVSPEDPIAEWPLEAIQTALERGGLADWRRLTAAIGVDPWGPIARTVEEVLSYSRPYGVAAVFEQAIDRSREYAERADRETVAAEIEHLVSKSTLSRAEFASRIGTSTSRLSTYVTGKVTPSAALLLRMRRVGVNGSPKPRAPSPAGSA